LVVVTSDIKLIEIIVGSSYGNKKLWEFTIAAIIS
jgi:hypothetical protein